jgi:hypothetical protein
MFAKILRLKIMCLRVNFKKTVKFELIPIRNFWIRTGMTWGRSGSGKIGYKQSLWIRPLSGSTTLVVSIFVLTLNCTYPCVYVQSFLHFLTHTKKLKAVPSAWGAGPRARPGIGPGTGSGTGPHFILHFREKKIS